MMPTLVTALVIAGSSSPVEVPLNWRVGGDLFATAEPVAAGGGDVVWRAGDAMIDTPLPEGYPAPTPPGAIEVKRYPTVRRAEARGDSGLSFWKLFRHIKRREIAMTAPVEVDYEGLDSGGGRPEARSMSFLYRTPELGPVGEDGSVRIYDTEPIVVLSLGSQGRNDWRTASAGLATLEAWIEAQNEWRISGEPRALHYNDPGVSASRRWMEIQVPVRKAAD